MGQKFESCSVSRTRSDPAVSAECRVHFSRRCRFIRVVSRDFAHRMAFLEHRKTPRRRKATRRSFIASKCPTSAMSFTISHADETILQVGDWVRCESFVGPGDIGRIHAPACGAQLAMAGVAQPAPLEGRGGTAVAGPSPGVARRWESESREYGTCRPGEKACCHRQRRWCGRRSD